MSDKKKANRELYALTANKYFDEIPLREITEILSNNGINLLQEDGTAWSGILCGDNSHCNIDTNLRSLLSLSWYKMQSGRYEITVYLS